MGYSFLQQIAWSANFMLYKDAGGHSISSNTMRMIGVKVSHPFPSRFARTITRPLTRPLTRSVALTRVRVCARALPLPRASCRTSLASCLPAAPPRGSARSSRARLSRSLADFDPYLNLGPSVRLPQQP